MPKTSAHCLTGSALARVSTASKPFCTKDWKDCHWLSKTWRCCPTSTSIDVAPATTTVLKQEHRNAIEPDLEKLQTLHVRGMIKALSEQHPPPVSIGYGVGNLSLYAGLLICFPPYWTNPLYTSVAAPSFLMISLFPSASDSTFSEQPSTDALPSTDSVLVSKLTA